MLMIFGSHIHAYIHRYVICSMVRSILEMAMVLCLTLKMHMISVSEVHRFQEDVPEIGIFLISLVFHSQYGYHSCRRRSQVFIIVLCLIMNIFIWYFHSVSVDFARRSSSVDLTSAHIPGLLRFRNLGSGDNRSSVLGATSVRIESEQRVRHSCFAHIFSYGLSSV